MARSSIFEEGREEEKEEEGLFDKVGTTDHEMPTVVKVGAIIALEGQTQKWKGRIHSPQHGGINAFHEEIGQQPLPLRSHLFDG